MKKFAFSLLVGGLIVSCVAAFNRNKTDKIIASASISDQNTMKGIWQLDYYPDSIFIKRNIYGCSKWKSSFAYNVKIENDSCYFTGWHEGWANKIDQNNGRSIKTLPGSGQYFEIHSLSANKMEMREMNDRRSHTDSSIFYPYHRVDKVLTQEALQKRLAKEIFAGRYKLLFADTLVCEKYITFDSDFGVKGINGISNYKIETEIDFDYPIPNCFILYNPETQMKDYNNIGTGAFSFSFSRDTLFLNGNKAVQIDGDFDHVAITKPRIKLLKVK
jgi:hypothetical protein